MPVTYQAGQSIDHYEIIKLLGQGGASHVYLALDRHTQQEIVLKFPNIDEIGTADIYARYQREIQIGKRLNHPHIQHHLNQEEKRSADYLVLEYMRGQTLRELIHHQKPELLPIDEAIRIIAQVVDALVYSHEQNVIHRDIKPENIMLLENGEVVLFDFGIAQWKEERFIRWRGFGKPIGTPSYMSPELLWGRAGLVQSDIYAIGAVLYELLCGHPPFEERNGFDFLSEHVSHDPPDILTYKPTLPPALATIVMHCVRRDPERRYSDTRTLLQDLLHFDKVKPVDYQPEPPKLGRRYIEAIRITVIILIVLLCIVGFGVLAQLAHHTAH